MQVKKIAFLPRVINSVVIGLTLFYIYFRCLLKKMFLNPNWISCAGKMVTEKGYHNSKRKFFLIFVNITQIKFFQKIFFKRHLKSIQHSVVSPWILQNVLFIINTLQFGPDSYYLLFLQNCYIYPSDYFSQVIS